MNIRAALSLTLAGWLAMTPIGAVDIYVDGANGDDANDGTSRNNAVRTITTALTLTSSPGDQVLVLPGTYTECFDTGFNEIVIRSTEFDTSGTNTATILDGGGNLGCGADYPVAILDGGSTLQGFTVRRGKTTGVVAFGGAVITNNLITGNSGTWGGGVYAFGSAIVTNNVIAQNTAAYGGGIYAYATDFYGDTDAMQIADNEIRDNEATLDGGGAYVFSFPQNGTGPIVTVGGNELLDNTAEGFAGGVGVFTYTMPDTVAGVRVTGNLIEGNDVTGSPIGGAYVGYGGGIWAGTNGAGTETIRIDDNTIRRNTTTVAGGGASTWVRGSGEEGAAPAHEITLERNDVTANTSGRDGGGFDLYMEALSLQAGAASMTLRSQDNLIADNDASTTGGIGGGLVALLVSERTGTSGELAFSVERDEITGNTAGSGGGAAVLVISNADPAPPDPLDPRAPSPASAKIRMSNTLLTRNVAADRSGSGAGAGVLTYLDANGDADAIGELDLLTIASNVASIGGAVEIETLTSDDTTATEGRATLAMRNSIVASNDAFAVGGPTPGSEGTLTSGGTGNLEFTLSYSNLFGNGSGTIESSVTPDSTVGNQIGIDPLLGADQIPGRCSPTIDAGDPTADVGDEPADNGGRINMGDLGGTVSAVRTLSDINGDGLVDGLDVIRITTRFGASPPGTAYLPAADFDDNLLIDGEDLALVGADFGLECP